MEPNKFRESRQAINRVYENILTLIDNKDLEASTEKHQEIKGQLDLLKPQAEGEIQERSVKNLGLKIRALTPYIAKLKPKKKAADRRKKGIKTEITWDEERVGQLSEVFLGKVFSNMGNDTNARVCFGTTGKGIRPSYHIEFGNQEATTFSGSGHKPVKKSLSTAAKKASQSFSYQVIDSILKGN